MYSKEPYKLLVVHRGGIWNIWKYRVPMCEIKRHKLYEGYELYEMKYK